MSMLEGVRRDRRRRVLLFLVAVLFAALMLAVAGEFPELAVIVP